MQKPNFFLVHSTEGNPDEAWYPWLKKELHVLGYRTISPQFPTPSGQTLDNWLKVFDTYKWFVHENTIFIGRSVGVPFILHVLEKQQAKASFLVAGFCSDIGEEYRHLLHTFTESGFDLASIKKHCEYFFVYYSDNDPYIEQAKLEEVAEKLCVKGILVKGAGHFNTKSGYTTFPIILEDIRKML
ncbi:MAG: alpha/beta hydrolase [Candidatus Aenigmarchaeota archaeon]|nr:alpha/beta hydrolase [Candidatus Aenigmarchaeota archaeon]